MILEKATADTEQARLERLARAHDRAHTGLQHLVENTTRRLQAIEAELPAADAAAARTRSSRGEAFTFTVDTHPAHAIPARTEAAEALAALITGRRSAAAARLGDRDIDLGRVADLAGHTVHAAYRPVLWNPGAQGQYVFTFGPDVPPSVAVTTPASPQAITVGLIRRLENAAADQIPARPGELRREHAERSAELAKARDRLGQPFETRRPAHRRPRQHRPHRRRRGRPLRAGPRCV